MDSYVPNSTSRPGSSTQIRSNHRCHHSIDADATVAVLDTIGAQHGSPQVIRCDNGPGRTATRWGTDAVTGIGHVSLT
jgi:hypothetical protein